MSRLALVFGAALVALELTVAIALAATSNHESELGSGYALAVTAGVAFMVSGLIALWRRPDNRTGVYLAGVGYLWFLGALTESNNPWIYAVGFVLGGIAFIPFSALLLSHPTGRFETPFDRVFPWVVGGVVVSLALAIALVSPTFDSECDACPENPLALTDAAGAVTALKAVDTAAGIVLALIAVVLMIRRWRRASPSLRRALWPVLIAGGAALAALVIEGLVSQLVSIDAGDAFAPVFLACFAAVPIAFLLGILRVRLARSSVSELVVALEGGQPLREALAGALGDHDLDVVYWLDWRRGLGGAGWVDLQGQSVDEPVPNDRRSVKMVERNGDRVAAIVYDNGLDAEPELVEAVTAAASLALQNDRLQAELRAEVSFITTVTNTAPSLLVNIGTDGRIRNVNIAALEASGYDDEERVRGEHYWTLFIDPGERDGMIARFNALSPDFPPGEYENTFTNARGEIRTIYWRAAPVKDATGRVVSIVSGGLDITERRKRELELERERDATTTALEAIPSIAVVLDRDGAIRDRDVDNPRVGANRAFRQALGWRDHELVGRSFMDLIVEDDDGRAATAVATAAAGGASNEVESELRGADGSLRAFLWTAVPVADVTGRTDALVLLSGIDVTERRRLELEKERERAFLNAIANNAPSLLCLIDDEGRMTSMGANIGFERALEYEPEAIGGQIFWEQFVEPAEADEVRRLIEDVVGGGAPMEHDSTWLASSGRRLTIAWTCTPLPDLDERTLFLLTGVDVTERQLRAAQVRDGEERLRTVIERAPVAIVEVGLDDLVKLWNPAAERIFGWSPEEVLGRPAPMVAPGLEADYRSILAEVRGGHAHEALETVGLCKNGSLVDVEISTAPIRDAAGAVAGHIAVFSDVSERKRHNEELRASRSRIVEAGDEARRQLERNLHDGAQQRLVALSVSMRLAESKIATDPAVATETLAGARDELTQALGELRELARGIHPAVLTDRGLAPAIEGLVARTPVPVETDVLSGRLPPSVEAAAYYVVAEALTNVARYANAQEASVQVDREVGRVIVEVSDDGDGGADPTQGSGLRGLADRVAALDGTLVVASLAGEGTTVRAEIPLAVDGPAYG